MASLCDLLFTVFRLNALLEVKDLVLLDHGLAYATPVRVPYISQNELFVALVHWNAFSLVVIVRWVAILRTVCHIVALILAAFADIVRPYRPLITTFSGARLDTNLGRSKLACSLPMRVHMHVMVHARAPILVRPSSISPSAHTPVIIAMIGVVTVRIAPASLIRLLNRSDCRGDKIVFKALVLVHLVRVGQLGALLVEELGLLEERFLSGDLLEDEADGAGVRRDLDPLLIFRILLLIEDKHGGLLLLLCLVKHIAIIKERTVYF